QSDVIVQPNDHLARLAQGGPGPVVEVVGVRNHRVQAVVPAGQLEDDQDRVLARRRRLRGARNEAGDDLAQGDQRRALQRLAQDRPATEHGRRPFGKGSRTRITNQASWYSAVVRIAWTASRTRRSRRAPVGSPSATNADSCSRTSGRTPPGRWRSRRAGTT